MRTKLMAQAISGFVVALTLASATAASAQQLREVSMGLSSTSFVTFPAYAASELGLFKKHGLDVKMTVMTDASIATSALIGGSIDTIAAAASDAVAATLNGQEIVVFENLYNGFSGSLIFSKATAEKLGVSPTAPVADKLKALKGLIIASPSASSNFTLAPRGAAKSVGADVRFAYVGQPAMAAALKSSAVQGFVASAPLWVQAVNDGDGVIWLSGPKGEFERQFTPASASLMEARRDYAQAHPDVIRDMKAGFADFVDLVKKDPDQIKQLMKKRYPSLDDKMVGLLFEAEAEAWKAVPYGAADMAHDIEYIIAGGLKLPNIEKLDPASLIFK